MSWDHPEIRDAIRRAIAEDVGSGDATTEACVPEALSSGGIFLARESFVLAGGELLSLIYDQEDVALLESDGAVVGPGTVLARVQGTARRLLTLERTALNFLQRTSGIATQTRRFLTEIEGFGSRLLDTRKTTPGLRRVEKLSVRAGGGLNHRTGLFDGILIKNNHIAAAGGVRAALERCRHADLPVEIEVRSFAELDEALAGGAQRLLLDNFTPEEAAEAVGRINGRASVEISGGITLETAPAYAKSGADFLSVGALTHSARAVDISFRLDRPL